MDANSDKHHGKIRIAYILRAEERGGVEEHVLSLIKHINPAKFEIFIIAPPQLVEIFGQDLTSTSAKILPLEIRGLLDFKGMKAFFHFLRINKIQIVNTHMFIASLHFSPVAWAAGVPVLLETSHGVEKWRLEKSYLKRNSFFIDRWYAKLQNKILAVSHACCNDLINIKKISPQKIVVVQNGRDLDDFSRVSDKRRSELRQQYALKVDDYVFGVLARLDFQKGHRYLLDAIRLLANRRNDFMVLIVGDGGMREELMNQAKRLEIEEYLIFTGFQKDMPGYLGMIDVGVLPSLYEGLPLGLIEASAMGKPVIATSVDGTPEVIVNNETGLLVAPREPQALCNAMEYALEHKEHMQTMGQNGRMFVTRHFTLKRQIEETEKMYEELLLDASARTYI